MAGPRVGILHRLLAAAAFFMGFVVAELRQARPRVDFALATLEELIEIASMLAPCVPASARSL